MSKSNLQVAIASGSRDVHAANLAMMPEMYANYEKFHEELFGEKGRSPYLAVNENEDGTHTVLARNSDREEAYNVVATNAGSTLRHEDYITIRDRIVEIRRRALNGIADLEAMGLTFPAAIEDQLVGFENVNEFDDAQQDQNPAGSNTGNNDTTYCEIFTPNPITHIGFTVPFRQTGFDYKRSAGLRESVRKTSERLERTLFNGNADIKVNFNGTLTHIYGYTTHPDRGQGTISDWTDIANRDLIVPETNDQIGKMWANQGGVANDSLIMYVANDIWQMFQNDYNSNNPSKTILDRVKDISQLMDVKPAEYLAAGQVVLVEMDARTIELAKASDIVTVPHIKTNPLAPQEFTTYAAMVHQIKVDQNGNTGVRHLTV